MYVCVCVCVCINGQSGCGRFGSKDPRFESCIQQRKTTCHYRFKGRLPVPEHRNYICIMIRDSSVSLSAGIQSAGDWVSETLWVRILHSAEEDNLSPFDSKIACLCQSIEINNNKYVYRQSQVRMPNGSGVRWAECLQIIGTGCRVQVFLAWSSIAQSVCQQAFSLLEIGFQRPSGFESCIQQRKTTCLLSIRKSPACARASKLTTTNMYVCMYVCVCVYKRAIRLREIRFQRPWVRILHSAEEDNLSPSIQKSPAYARASKLYMYNDPR